MLYSISCECVSGLARLESLSALVSSKDIELELDPVMVEDIEDCYSLLRHIDGRIPEGDKYIVLDLTSHTDIQTILNQVGNNT